ncbi:GIY-YIG nuclease family protein [Desulfatitalea alkaliphila]|uniref:GIY-YIG nuclease family protein n=1 Tax=Desulfatitalea alkaliphila TaxID=2929485 RepID=A0AA41R519_9BACT|nr:GIY-YIG nuclease family protein [Desulfatitalea alkaliphila]MCJ8501095.1 GIY-YIG nuclease family protein [Desulfatitalea alkaliphila]
MSKLHDSLPDAKGSYLLILFLPGSRTIQVGRLGPMVFDRGWYVYAGSAFGPGGLAARLGRHLQPLVKAHWHIDHLRTAAKVVAAWMAIGPPVREHDWAAALTEGPEAGTAVRGFGCSDCRCLSHLIHFTRRPGRILLRAKLGFDVVAAPLKEIVKQRPKTPHRAGSSTNV